MLLIGPEIAMNALGTVWAFTEYIKCDNEEFTETAIESKYSLTDAKFDANHFDFGCPWTGKKFVKK